MRRSLFAVGVTASLGLTTALGMAPAQARSSSIAFNSNNLPTYQANGVATLITAFSRVKGYPHRYVQHALEASADQVWQAMQNEPNAEPGPFQIDCR